MFETELKFQVPPGQRAALQRAVATASAVTTRLQAVYADTPDRQLAAAGLALRLRKEGRVWVQTLKGRGDGLMQRLEHEVALPAQRGVPVLDAKRHAGTPLGQQLLALLAGGAPLQPVYRTDIRRLHRRVRHAGALVELACDRGHILAGERRLAVDEIEFELIRGPRAALIDLAQRWSGRFDLWWDCRSKSEQGYRLALGLLKVPALPAEPSALTPAMDPAQAFAHSLRRALQQLLPLAAEIASDRCPDSSQAEPEPLHQLRVALRRLRTMLRVFAAWAPDAQAARALQRDWGAPFAILGLARDADVMARTLAPALAAAGAPPVVAAAPRPGESPGDVVRAAAFTALLLRTLALCDAPPASASAPAADVSLKQAARVVMRPLWRRVRRDAADFATAGVAAQHRARKRAKQLRYALEALQPLLRHKAGERLLRALRRALEPLGELQDLAVADAALRSQVMVESRACLADLAARRQRALRQADRALQRLRAKSLVWR